MDHLNILAFRVQLAPQASVVPSKDLWAYPGNFVTDKLTNTPSIKYRCFKYVEKHIINKKHWWTFVEITSMIFQMSNILREMKYLYMSFNIGGVTIKPSKKGTF